MLNYIFNMAISRILEAGGARHLPTRPLYFYMSNNFERLCNYFRFQENPGNYF